MAYILEPPLLYGREQYEQSKYPAVFCKVRASEDEQDRQHQEFEHGFAER
jgi:hypothetical protein